MNSRVLWTSAAQEDLIDIGYFIGVENERPLTADKILDEIHANCERYARFPRLGQRYPELDDHRGFLYKRWLIVYRPIQGGIEVMAVLDSASDYAERFRERF